MKPTGIIRKLDRLGRIVLPMELRKCWSISSDTALEMFTDTNKIVLRVYQPGCTICGNIDESVTYYNKKAVCSTCISSLP